MNTSRKNPKNVARRGGDWMQAAKRVAGVVFVGTGALKLAAPSQPGFAGGGRGFGQALSTLHVPFSAFFGYAIPLLECAGGAVLCGSWLLARQQEGTAKSAVANGALVKGIDATERSFCFLLACDMIAAIALVGVPGALGHPLRVGNLEIGNEKWRLPLEIALLFIVAQRARKPQRP